MTSPATDVDAEQVLEIDLRDRNKAALLSWLIPGAGHLYQGRTAKGVLFMVCVLGTFMFGMILGEGRVVYASWGPSSDEKRLPYLLQMGVGLPALPAMFNTVFDTRLFGEVLAAPSLSPPPVPPNHPSVFDPKEIGQQPVPDMLWFRDKHGAVWRQEMNRLDEQTAAPIVKLVDDENSSKVHKDELAKWMGTIDGFDLGTVYTMIAGLLNVLVIYDAWGGPIMSMPRRKHDLEDDEDDVGSLKLSPENESSDGDSSEEEPRADSQE